MPFRAPFGPAARVRAALGTVLAGTALVGACSHTTDVTQPSASPVARVSGAYQLNTVNAQGLPATIGRGPGYAISGAYPNEAVVVDSVTLAADGSAAESFTYSIAYPPATVVPVDGPANPWVLSDGRKGTWTLAGATVTILWSGAPVNWFRSVDSATVSANGRQLTFLRSFQSGTASWVFAR